MIDGSQQTLPVTVEWARLGKGKQDPGYRVLECSNGALDEKNFKELLTRYSPGTLELADLPQVTISWSKGQRQGQHYVGIAKHYRQESGEGDASGRWVMLTNYFCVPFKTMLDGSVSYLAMHDKLANIVLPLSPNDAIVTHLPRPLWSDFAFDSYSWLAMRAAASLMTSTPVCVLGADHTGYIDRLRFIDMVATLLPYGMRSELSASTWASPTYRTHKLRLFFADADRGKGDRVVVWGQPADGKIGHAYADEYLQLLRSGTLTPRVLAEQTTPTGFDGRRVLQVLERLRTLNGARKRAVVESARPGAPVAEDARPAAIAGVSVPPVVSPAARPALPPDDARPTELEPHDHPAWQFEPDGVPDVSLGRPARAGAQPAAPDRVDDISDVKEILTSCSYALNQDDERLLRDGMEQLRGHLHDRPAPARNRLKEILTDYQLLGRSSFSNVALLQEFYGLLLQLAFSSPLRFQGYKYVETIAGCSPGQRLHNPLALAMLRIPKEGAARLMALNSLDNTEFDFAVTEYPIAPYESVAMLVEALDPQYVEIVTDMALRNLRKSSKTSEHDRELFRDAIARHRLVATLQQRYASEPDRLCHVLDKMLEYAYENNLSLSAAQRLLDDVRAAPGEALLGVMLTMAKPKDLDPIKREFLLRRMIYAGFSDDVLGALRDLVVGDGSSESRWSRSPKPAGHKFSVNNSKFIWAFIAFLVLVVAGTLVAVVHILTQSIR
jgi:hypothetical protein